MTKVIAVMDFPYDGKEMKAGDEFEATEKDAYVLKVYGRVTICAEDSIPPPKRRYKRRDMRATEE